MIWLLGWLGFNLFLFIVAVVAGWLGRRHYDKQLTRLDFYTVPARLDEHRYN